jgi:hypothetical protein
MKHCIIFCLLLFPFFLFSYLDVEYLHKVTNLPHVKIKNAIIWFASIEKWNETVSYYYGVFTRLINEYNLKKGCEIGVATGGHSYALLKNTKLEKLYSIDHYSPDFFIDFAKEGILELYVLCIKTRLGQFGNRSELLRMFSADAAYLFKKHELDFIFIDADHSYEAVKKDLMLWYEKVRAGGIVGGDDYVGIWPGVKKAVDEFFTPIGLRINQDKEQPRIWWVQKP